MLTENENSMNGMLNGLRSETTRARYGAAAQAFLSSGHPLTAEGIMEHLVGMETRGAAPATLNLHLAALRSLAKSSPIGGEADKICAIKGWRAQGVRQGNWLSKDQAQALLDLPDAATLDGLRDRAVLAVLLGGGLRRSELVALNVAQIQIREGVTCLLDITGKGRKVRTVALPPWAAAALGAWRQAAGITSGPVFRPVRRACGDWKVYSRRLSEEWVYLMVTTYVKKLPGGITAAPHDMRRTFGKLSLKGGAKLPQIQESLGHSSLVTTQRYLGGTLDIHDAPGNYMGLE